MHIRALLGIAPVLMLLAMLSAAAAAGSSASAPTAREVQAVDESLDYAAARVRLREVLARREFQHQDRTRWADMVRQRIGEWVQSLLARLGARGPSAAMLGHVLAWVVAIGVLLIASIWLFRARRLRGDRRWPIVATVPRLSSREWAARAGTALAAGDAKEALRCAYHAVLFRFEEQGVWRVDDSRTPREYVRLLGDAAANAAGSEAAGDADRDASADAAADAIPAGAHRTARGARAMASTSPWAQEARRTAFADLTRDFELSWYGSQAVRADTFSARLEALGCPVPPAPGEDRRGHT